MLYARHYVTTRKGNKTYSRPTSPILKTLGMGVAGILVFMLIVAIWPLVLAVVCIAIVVMVLAYIIKHRAPARPKHRKQA